MSGRVKVTVDGESKFFPKDNSTYQMLEGMESDGVSFGVEDAPDANSDISNAVRDQLANDGHNQQIAGSLEGAETELKDIGYMRPAAPVQPLPVRSVSAPSKPKETFGTMVGDFAVPALNGATMGWGDELVGVFSDDAKKAMRARLALARSRSPNLSMAGDVTGAVGTTLLTGGAGGAGALANVARLGLLGAAAGAGNGETTEQRLEGAAVGGTLGASGGVLGIGATKLGALLGKTGAGIAAEANSPAWANKVGNAATEMIADSAGLGTGALGWTHAGPMGALVGAPARQMVKSAIQQPVNVAAQKLAPLLGKASGALFQGGGAVANAAGVVAANIGPAASSLSRQARNGADNSSAVKLALQVKPEMLGAYQSDLAQAAEKHDDAKLNAKITELIMNSEDFRSNVLPSLTGK